LPTFIPIPGVKLGLCNLVVILALLRYGFPSAAAVSLLRVLLSSILFGNMAAFFYSLAGAVLSLLVMALLKKTNRFSPAWHILSCTYIWQTECKMLSYSQAPQYRENFRSENTPYMRNLLRQTSIYIRFFHTCFL